MKKASVTDLRRHCARLLLWVERGEEVEITRRGIVVARLVPLAPGPEIDWNRSAALTREPWSRTLTAAESARILAQS
jgi:prevent-host-death family protein